MSARLPFRNMSRRGWVNLALAAVLTFYLIQVVLDIVWNNTCGHLGTDYCAFWSAGHAATRFGYAKVYDLGLLAREQLANFPAFGDRSTFAVSPFAYLPVFILPFQLLSVLSPTVSFWIWTLINAAAFVFYLRFFNQRTLNLPLPPRLLVMLALSLPVYWNFLDGQVNVWLMICVGEFLRLTLSDRPLKAGLWLGGLLLKPQTLVLLVPALLLRRSGKTLVGLSISAGILLVFSSALVGFAGIMGMLQVWLGFTKGMPTNDVDSMMNWRMIGFHLSNWVSPAVGIAVESVGIAVTIVVAAWIWKRSLMIGSKAFLVALLGLLAATGLVAWHSHIHVAMILIPPLVLLYRRRSLVNDGLLEAWVLLPSTAYFVVYVLAALVKLEALPENMSVSLNFIRGAAEFAMNIWILLLANRAVAAMREPATIEAGAIAI